MQVKKIRPYFTVFRDVEISTYKKEKIYPVNNFD